MSVGCTAYWGSQESRYSTCLLVAARTGEARRAGMSVGCTAYWGSQESRYKNPVGKGGVVTGTSSGENGRM